MVSAKLFFFLVSLYFLEKRTVGTSSRDSGGQMQDSIIQGYQLKKALSVRHTPYNLLVMRYPRFEHLSIEWITLCMP